MDDKQKKTWRKDGCIYNPSGIKCHLPALCGRIPAECVRCGWFPAEAKRRKLALLNRETACHSERSEESFGERGDPSTPLRVAQDDKCGALRVAQDDRKRGGESET